MKNKTGKYFKYTIGLVSKNPEQFEQSGMTIFSVYLIPQL
jgi:hypothetical protein